MCRHLLSFRDAHRDQLWTFNLRRHSDAAVIVYTPQEWQAFIEGVRDGEFDFA